MAVGSNHYIREQSYRIDVKIFVLPGFSHTEFLKNYVYKLEEQSIKIIAISTFFQPPKFEQLNQLCSTKSVAETLKKKQLFY